MRKVFVLNGPNLGRLGTRQPEVYGATTHAQLAEHLVGTGRGMGLDVEVRQTDHEGEMIGWLHEAASTGAAATGSGSDGSGCGVRTSTDTGRVVILDSRLLTRRYGKRIIDALPPFKRVIG